MKTAVKISFLFSLILFVACGSDDDNKEETPDSASITGEVVLYDDGIELMDNSSGMKVSIEGKEEYSAITDEEGQYTLEDLPLDTYVLKFEKDGYGTFKLFEVVLDEAGELLNIDHIPSLGKISTTEIESLGVTATEEIMVSVTTDPDANSNSPRYIRFFFNNQSSGVSSSDYSNFLETLQINENPHSKTFTKQDLLDMGFQSGETVYVKVYGESFYSNEYDMPDSELKAFPNLNRISADNVSFVVP